MKPPPAQASARVELQPGETPAQALARVQGAARKATRRGSKYGAVRTDGYASKAEARYAARLEGLKKMGAILDFLEQVPIKLAKGVTYRCDFMVLERDGSVRFVEVKGHETEAWTIKRNLLEDMRPEIAKRLEVVR